MRKSLCRWQLTVGRRGASRRIGSDDQPLHRRYGNVPAVTVTFGYGAAASIGVPALESLIAEAVFDSDAQIRGVVRPRTHAEQTDRR